MSRICLVTPAAQPTEGEPAALGPLVEALREAGYEVESREARSTGDPAGWPWSTGARGEAAGILSAWALTSADVLLTVDPRMDYHPESVVSAVDRVVRDPEVVAIGARYGGSRRPARSLVGRLLHWLTGSADPLSGLVSLSRGTFHSVALRLHPTSRSIAPEFLLSCPGITADVPVATSRRRGPWPRDLEQVKQLKRLTNLRLGNLSRLAQFCLVGFSGMLVDLASFSLLGKLLSSGAMAGRIVDLGGRPVHLSWVVAAGASISLALVWNFILNRHFTFSDARKHSGLGRQFLTYLLGNALAVSLSFLLRVGLPIWIGFFHEHRVAAAIVGVFLATGVSFSMSRWFVFRAHPRGVTTDPSRQRPGRGRQVRSASGGEVERVGI